MTYPCYQNFTVILQSHTVAVISTYSKMSGNFSITIKGGIQTTVNVVANQSKVIITPISAVTCHYYFSISLHGNAVTVVIRLDICSNNPITTKSGI